jgi:predicted nucleotidyltransferase
MTLKEAVFRISTHPALSPVGRSFYFLCERVLSRTFQGFPEIRSAYVSGSMSEGDIVPGLSDIDCVITIDDLGAREEYELMTELERKIRYRMPPLGKDKVGVHVVAYSSAEWFLLGGLFLGKKAGKPRKLFGRNERKPDHKLSGRIKALHHLYKAFWKIINLQDSTLKPSRNPLEPELTKRIIERTMITLDHAIEEVETGSVPEEYSVLRDHARESWKLFKATGDESKHIEMLAMLLHLFDVAAGAVYESATPGGGYPSGDVEPVGEIMILPAEITDIVPVIQQHQNDKDGVVYTNVNKTDIFLFNSANCELSAAIIKYYKRIGERGLRIMSIERFRQFYLNFSEQAAVDLFSGEPYTLMGIRDPEALLLDAYSILPQLRSPRNWKSGERYESFRGKAERIFQTLAAGRPGEQVSSTARIEKHGLPRDDYGRFADLRELSQALTSGLREFISSGYVEAHD